MKSPRKQAGTLPNYKWAPKTTNYLWDSTSQFETGGSAYIAPHCNPGLTACACCTLLGFNDRPYFLFLFLAANQNSNTEELKHIKRKITQGRHFNSRGRKLVYGRQEHLLYFFLSTHTLTHKQTHTHTQRRYCPTKHTHAHTHLPTPSL